MSTKITSKTSVKVTSRGILIDEITRESSLLPIKGAAGLLKIHRRYTGETLDDLMRVFEGDRDALADYIRTRRHTWRLVVDMLARSDFQDDFAFDSIYMDAKTRSDFDAAVRKFAEQGRRYSDAAAKAFLEGIKAGLDGKPAVALRRLRKAVSLWDTPWDDE